MSPAPKFVLSAGMVGSGSTFIYNVARELLIHDFPHPAPLSIYSDEWKERFVAERSLIVKCHGGSPSLLAAAESGLLRALVTIRHPGDSVCSDMERFGLSFAEALARVETSLRFSHSLIGLGASMVFRYEDGFTADVRTAGAVARFLGVETENKTVSQIFSKYDVDATRHLANQVDHLPDVLSNPYNGDAWSPVTQIHRHHIGKMVSGRWTALSSIERAIIAERCGKAAQSLGYTFDPMAH